VFNVSIWGLELCLGGLSPPVATGLSGLWTKVEQRTYNAVN